MTIRTDLVIDWRIGSTDYRIIWVPSTSDELTQQDLVDTTVKRFEAMPGYRHQLELMKSYGKQDIGGNVLVGITTEQQNFKVGFLPDLTPIVSGAATEIGTVYLSDLTADFSGVIEGATIVNFDDKSITTVIKVISSIKIKHTALEAGAANSWTVGDSYKIWNSTEKDFTGGNPTAKDYSGSSMSPILPTAFTSITKTSSSSATIQSIDLLESAAYQGFVWIDVDHGSAGTVIGKGTPGDRSNNIVDARAIADRENLRAYKIGGSIILDREYHHWSFEGIRSLSEDAVILNGQIINNSRFKNTTCIGPGIGTGVNFMECILYALSGVECLAIGSGVTAGYTCAGEGSIFSGKDLAGMDQPLIIDMIGSNRTCLLDITSGDWRFINAGGGSAILLTCTGGRVTIDSSCNGAVASIMGTGSFVNNGLNITMLNNEIINNDSILSAVTPSFDDLETKVDDVLLGQSVISDNVGIIFDRVKETLQGMAGTLDIIDNGDGTETIKVFDVGEIDPDTATPIFTMTASKMGLRRVRNL